MKHLLVWLLLSSLCSLSSWGIRDMLVVIQSPHNVTVTEGDSVQIQCCWNQNVSRGTVNWHKEGHIEIKYKSVLVTYSQCYDRASQQTVACNCSNWTISNVTRNYTGTYICKVSLEIPSLIESVGDGTRITVTSQNTTNNAPIPLVEYYLKGFVELLYLNIKQYRILHSCAYKIVCSLSNNVYICVHS
uniref:Ig-like domain-containing protein n=1 Tax=Oncorhynchus mykiss TaxID=8022 RepID=A0A8C7R9V8_ONCMY